MQFGVREISDVVFKAKAPMKIGTATFKEGQPVLYIDTAKASSLEGGATAVYATGGRGNTRLLSWEGEKTLTFTVEDALLSPIGFSILSGAGLFKDTLKKVNVHRTSRAFVSQAGVIDLTDVLGANEKINKNSPVFVSLVSEDGSLTGETIESLTIEVSTGKKLTGANSHKGKNVFVDYYVEKESAKVSEIQIDGAHFGGFFYVEASTLFRRKHDGVDMPAELTFPNVKIQSNFTFQMSSTGDPSTFEFKMDAFPGYTFFDKTKQVLCVMQVVEDAIAGSEVMTGVMLSDENFKPAPMPKDSITD